MGRTPRSRLRGIVMVAAAQVVASLLSTPWATAEPAQARAFAREAAPGSQVTFAQARVGVHHPVPRSFAQEAELTAADGAKGDVFGYAMAVSGSTALVGAYDKNAYTGAAYVFVRSQDGTWSQQAKLTASDGAPHDQFGFSVAISGSTAVVGAYGKNSYTGAAYVFVRSKDGTWTQQAELTASDGDSNDSFGSSVGIFRSTVVVSAFYRKNVYTGAAYVFVRSKDGTWAQQAELTAPDGTPYDQFGYSVAIFRSTVVVGAPYKNYSAGVVYAFARSKEGIWSQQAELSASDDYADDQFGFSVAISGSTAVVGAYGKNSYTGSAYVFVHSKDGTWSQQAALTASDGGPQDQFGACVAISGSTAVVGAWVMNSTAGAAYMFVRSKRKWSQRAELTASDGAQGDYFGSSVAISGSAAVVGAIGKNSFTGAAYVFAAL